MIRERVVPVALSVLIVILVAVVQDRSRCLAAVIATIPLTAPLAMWIVFSASQGDHRQTADFVGSLMVGFLANLVSWARAGSASASDGGSRPRWSLPRPSGSG
jgi:hypothetical protein